MTKKKDANAVEKENDTATEKKEGNKWYKIKQGKKGQPVFTVGRLPNKTAAINKLNDLFKKDHPNVENFKGRGEPLFLIEEGNENDIPIQIIGEGMDRVAKIGS